MKRRKWLLGGVGLAGILVLAVMGARWRGITLGTRKYAGPALPPSTLAVPPERNRTWRRESALAERVYAAWAARPLGDFQKGGKGDLPRILLGRFLARQQLAETNQIGRAHV